MPVRARRVETEHAITIAPRPPPNPLDPSPLRATPGAAQGAAAAARLPRAAARRGDGLRRRRGGTRPAPTPQLQRHARRLQGALLRQAARGAAGSDGGQAWKRRGSGRRQQAAAGSRLQCGRSGRFARRSPRSAVRRQQAAPPHMREVAGSKPAAPITKSPCLRPSARVRGTRRAAARLRQLER